MSNPKIHLKEQKKKKICKSLREDREEKIINTWEKYRNPGLGDGP